MNITPSRHSPFDFGGLSHLLIYRQAVMVPRKGDMNEDLGVINPAPVWIKRSSLSSGFLEAASRVPSLMMMSMFKTTKRSD